MTLCETVALIVGALPSYAGLSPRLPPTTRTRPIRLLVPFAPGGGADTLARIITPKLSEAMGQQWVVDNRGGAAGNIAAETVARAAPDGYTVFMGFSTVLTVNPSLYKLTFDVEKDLQPVTLLATAQYILVLHPSVQAASVKELVALLKQKPRSLNFASAGVGSPLHLAGELFQRRAGVQMTHIPYKGGGPAAAAVLAGEAQLIFGSVASSMPQVKAGRLKALATTGLKRSKVAPDLPTMAEQGFPGFDVSTWYCLHGPGRDAGGDRRRGCATRRSRRCSGPTSSRSWRRRGSKSRRARRRSSPRASAPRRKTWAEVIKAAGIKAE